MLWGARVMVEEQTDQMVGSRTIWILPGSGRRNTLKTFLSRGLTQMIRFVNNSESNVEAGRHESRLELRTPYTWETTVLFKYRMVRTSMKAVAVAMWRRDAKECWQDKDLESKNVREEWDCGWWMLVFYRLGNDSSENDTYSLKLRQRGYCQQWVSMQFFGNILYIKVKIIKSFCNDYKFWNYAFYFLCIFDILNKSETKKVSLMNFLN